MGGGAILFPAHLTGLLPEGDFDGPTPTTFWRRGVNFMYTDTEGKFKR